MLTVKMSRNCTSCWWWPECLRFTQVQWLDLVTNCKSFRAQFAGENTVSAWLPTNNGTTVSNALHGRTLKASEEWNEKSWGIPTNSEQLALMAIIELSEASDSRLPTPEHPLRWKIGFYLISWSKMWECDVNGGERLVRTSSCAEFVRGFGTEMRIVLHWIILNVTRWCGMISWSFSTILVLVSLFSNDSWCS
jgi:hypothetical protein